jgi:hypothetical protein
MKIMQRTRNKICWKALVQDQSNHNKVHPLKPNHEKLNLKGVLVSQRFDPKNHISISRITLNIIATKNEIM